MTAAEYVVARFKDVYYQTFSPASASTAPPPVSPPVKSELGRLSFSRPLPRRGRYLRSIDGVEDDDGGRDDNEFEERESPGLRTNVNDEGSEGRQAPTRWTSRYRTPVTHSRPRQASQAAQTRSQT
ncbi:hypothetical protein DL767_010083 [Monosporascus sp. MG133]|nr:hypothetical protein DL767_010083 [Monosporascus sp. MG133]